MYYSTAGLLYVFMLVEQMKWKIFAAVAIVKLQWNHQGINMRFACQSTIYSSMQASSQKFAMGGGCLGVWGRSPQRSKILHFFCKNNFILGLF